MKRIYNITATSPFPEKSRQTYFVSLTDSHIKYTMLGYDVKCLRKYFEKIFFKESSRNNTVKN
jgi:hypothetical protein